MALYSSGFVYSWDRIFHPPETGVMTDVSRLLPRRVLRVEPVRKVEQLQEVLAEARAGGLKVSIAGSQHSQGGHTYYDDAIVLQMHSFNEVLEIDKEKLQIRVESGCTWDQLQRVLAPQGLAMHVMQSSNIFTVGGTLSANAHGRDIFVTDIVEVVDSFRLMLASGEIVQVSRDTNPELFSLVIGGYGMYGVILDVTLNIHVDELYEQHAVLMDYSEFPAYFASHIEDNREISLLLARPSIDPAPGSFLKEIAVVTWEHTTGEAPPYVLSEEKNVTRDKFFFGASRSLDAMKSFRWYAQKRVELGTTSARIVSRNNAMRPPVAPLALLDYYSVDDTEIIQEYYVPTRNFVPFMDAMRSILTEHDLNVMSSTVRYVKANDETALAYAPDEDVFAIIQVSNVSLSEEGQRTAEAATLALVDAAIELDGTYYLTYQLYPTPEQLHRAYPTAAWAFERKRHYDPNELFMSLFYERYGKTNN